MAQSLIDVFGAEGVAKLKVLLGEVGATAGVEIAQSSGMHDPPSLAGGGLGSSRHDDHLDGGGSSAASSWSEMVEEELAAAGPSEARGVSVVSGVPQVSQEVRSSVTFGGFGTGGFHAACVEGGLMSQYVRTELARGLRKELAGVGVRMPKASSYMLALCTHTSATMPAFFRGGKDKLKSLAVLGDAVLVAAVAADSIQRGEACESLQQVRTTKLTDAHMSRVFAASRFARFVSVAAGVSLKHSKTGATALEALVGLVAYYRSPTDVNLLAREFGLLM